MFHLKVGRARWLMPVITALSEAKAGGSTRSRDRDHPGKHDANPSLLKNTIISWAWWHAPVVSATQEAEAGELLKSRRQRLQLAEIAPLHSSLVTEWKNEGKTKGNYGLPAGQYRRIIIRGSGRERNIGILELSCR